MTPHGKQGQQIVLDGRRRIAMEQKKIGEELMALQGISPPPQPAKVKESVASSSLGRFWCGD